MITAKEAKNRERTDANINTIEDISNKIFAEIEKATVAGKKEAFVKIPFAENILGNIIERFETLGYEVFVEKHAQNIYTIVTVLWSKDSNENLQDGDSNEDR